jgi:hypothetical protein
MRHAHHGRAIDEQHAAVIVVKGRTRWLLMRRPVRVLYWSVVSSVVFGTVVEVLAREMNVCRWKKQRAGQRNHQQAADAALRC